MQIRRKMLQMERKNIYTNKNRKTGKIQDRKSTHLCIVLCIAVVIIKMLTIH